MKIVVLDTYEALSLYAADIVEALVRHKPSCVLGLPTGSTPIGMYKELARRHREEGLDFSQVTTFNLDEYAGVGKDLSKPYALDQSFARFMWEEFFKHINIKEENINILNGLAKDRAKECQEYEEEIQKAGGIDLQVMGIGGDGHFAFNEPGSAFDSRTREVQLDQQTIDDNYEKFYKQARVSKEDMPHSALTMGIATVLEVRKIIQIIGGENRADIVHEAFFGPITEQIPSSILQESGDEFTLVLDKAAASRLPQAATAK